MSGCDSCGAPLVEGALGDGRGNAFCDWECHDSYMDEKLEDVVNHPKHYTQYPVEVIEITENLNFCKGNAVKYILRAEFKGNEIQDLEKSRWYIEREIQRIKGNE